MPGYSPSREEQMRAFSHSLLEKDRRRYAAIEAYQLGYGGISYVVRVLDCDRHTLTQGLEELTAPEALQQPRIRRVGSSRKPSHEHPGAGGSFSSGTPGAHNRLTYAGYGQVDQSHTPRDGRPPGRRPWNRRPCHSRQAPVVAP